MRVLFSVSDWPGHWFPMVPLGWALRAAGHDVRVVCAPSQTEPLTRAGLTPVPILDGWDMTFQARLQNYLNARDGLWPFAELPPHPLTGEPLGDLAEFDLGGWFEEHNPGIVAAATRSTDAAVAFGRAWRPELLVHDLVSIEGLLNARVLGVPSAVHLWGAVGTDENEPGLDLVPVDTSKAFDRYGVGQAGFEKVTHAIDPTPGPLAPPLGAERLPLRVVPYNGPGSMPGWTLERPARRRVCVVWGTSVTRMYGPVTFAVPRILDALGRLDVEVVVAVTGEDRARLGEVPDGVRVLERVPLHLLLPSCDLVVHHAGAGVVSTSLAAGVPQLAVPNGLDQSLIARRVTASGAGLDIPGQFAGTDAIEAAAAELLGSGTYRAAALALREENERNPSPADVAATLTAPAARR
ncbi:nucleotide disphospho-sugar-binding domain-containing protein, partial [Streptomyces sp. NRRL F-5126]|uniref:nucleotide disphospho-sugar-binding domain-containing protein n=1 Tax=Streptomyces sp. NRRL F-5126 TaxID=1463857 RepID=UPI0004C77C87